MPALPSVQAPTSEHGETTGQNYRPALTLLASLFFIWGFITVINNTLLPHLRAVFALTYTQTTLLESVWFIAYFVASLPSAWLIERVGYQRAMVTGLIIMAAGALLMIPAAHIPSYVVVLSALFVIASGITLLQVAANPYVAVVGPAQTAPARLNLVQAFNSLGTTLAPLFGGYLILGRSVSGTAAPGARSLTMAERLPDAQSVQLPYLLVAAVLIVLAVVIGRFPLPAMGVAVSRVPKSQRQRHSLWRHRNLVFGVPAIFIYLIAEIGVSNLFINFVSQPTIGNLSHEQASHYLFLLWGGMMVGRFAGSALMRSAGRIGVGGRECRRIRGDADCQCRNRSLGDVGADIGRLVPFHHVPDHLHARNPRSRSFDRGRLGALDHGHRGRFFGDNPGRLGGRVRSAGVLFAHRVL